MTFKEIILKFDALDLANALGVSIVTVRQWGNRKSIPAKYWVKLISLAEGTGVSLSLSDLATAASLESESA